MSNTFHISDGDVIISSNTGRPTLISDGKKLKQDLAEFFLIQVLPNGFGAGIDTMIGLVDVSPEVFVSMVNRQIREGFNAFLELQNADLRIPRPTNERLVAMTYLIVEKDKTDPTRFWFRANFSTEDGTEVPLELPLTV